MININPQVFGKLEVGWWVAHNQKDKQKMYELLVAQTVQLYSLSEEVAKNALRELVLGVSYHDTREWDKAIDAVEIYYQKIKDGSGLKFDPRSIAELEVGWWRLHDDLENNPDKSQLALLFAKLYSGLYGIKESDLITAGNLKVQATREHDLAEDQNTPPDQINIHWKKAEELLVSFYEEIRRNLI